MAYQPYIERVIVRLQAQYVQAQDRALLDLLFAPAPSQAMLDECLRVCDIEAMGAHTSLLLSYLMREHPELRFSAYVAPRLKGLMNFFRFANLKTLAHFSKIGKALNAAGIPIVIFKGAAMKIMRPEFSRPMGDVDILIPQERLAEAVRLCEKLGYHDSMEGAKHAVDIHTPENESALDIHHHIFNAKDSRGLRSEPFQSKMLGRARPCLAFGVQILLPRPEDLFFLVLTNLIKNLLEKTSIRTVFYALLDCRFLLSRADFDWAIVRADALEAKAELQLRLAAEFVNALAPGLLPDIDRHVPLGKEMENFCERIIFDEDFLQQQREACRAIRVVDLKNYPWHYSKMILTLLLLKKLRAFPAFVRWYLRKHSQETAHARG